jgi:hypothetical protein
VAAVVVDRAEVAAAEAVAALIATVIAIATVGEVVAAAEIHARVAGSRPRTIGIAPGSLANLAGNEATRANNSGCPHMLPLKEIGMATSKSTFQKRQKEMKRQEKQRMKAERRAQKKLTGRQDADFPMEPLTGPIVDPELLFPDTEEEV